MNIETSNLLSTLEGLFKISIKMSDRQDMDTISISKTRAKMLLSEIKTLQKNKTKNIYKSMKREPLWLSNPY